MRILYLGTAENEHLRRWVEAAVARGHEAHVATFEPPASMDGWSAVIHPLHGDRSRLIRYLGALADVRDLARRLRPDLLHAHFLTGYGYLAPWIGVRPWALTVWGTDILRNPDRSRADAWLSIRALRSADLVIGDSGDAVARAEMLGARPHSSVVVPWGVELDLFQRVEERRAAILDRWGLPRDAQVLLSARSLAEPFYRVADVVDASLQIMAVRSRVHLVVAGEGRLAGDLKQAVAGHVAADRVRWVGQVDRPTLAGLMGVAEAYLSVPTHDATSVALLEAMAAGAPVIASDLPSNREWVGDGAGRIVPAGDSAALAHAILAVLDDPTGAQRAADEAQARVAQHAGVERCQDRLDALIGAIVRPRAQSQG